MEPSIAGLLVCAGLLLVGWRLRAPVIVALFASLPFGSTALGTITALGGSSPLIYTLFCSILIIATVFRRSFPREIGKVLRTYPCAWVLIGLVLYAVCGAVFLPRLFAGQTTAFVIYRGGILELALAPNSGNITQPAYFALGALTFFVFTIALTRPGNLKAVRTGFFAFVMANALLGLVDLAGKLAGMGDILLPIRTANYSLLTEIAEAGFWRIVGGYPEASAFAIGTLACLAFSFTYWRSSGSRAAGLLAAVSFVLVLLSTSSTAYIGLALMGTVLAATAAKRFGVGRISQRDLFVLCCFFVGCAGVMAVYVTHAKMLDPVVSLIDTTLLKKAASQSGQERAYWNARSLVAVLDTWGLGVGLGSSRASSWLIAVVSQLGVAGSLLMAVLVLEMARGPRPSRNVGRSREDLALYRAARACGLAYLMGGAVSGGAADPGVLFFICLAVVVSSGSPRTVAARPEIARAPFPDAGLAR